MNAAANEFSGGIEDSETRGKRLAQALERLREMVARETDPFREAVLRTALAEAECI